MSHVSIAHEVLLHQHKLERGVLRLLLCGQRERERLVYGHETHPLLLRCEGQ
jgi:hypothetical protein